jgi:hypothetical protein
MHEIGGHNNQNIILFIWPNAQHFVWEGLFTFYLEDQSPNEIIMKFMSEVSVLA